MIFAAVVAALVAVEVLSGSSNTSGPGRPAPGLPSDVLVGPKVTVASLRGRPAAINFWASWCAPCREEAPAFERLARSLHGRATLVGVDWNDSLDGARSFIDEHRLTYPNLRDADGSVGDRYRITGLPTTFILDSRGRIETALRGPQDVSNVEQALSAAR